jgi:hypothetical protein
MAKRLQEIAKFIKEEGSKKLIVSFEMARSRELISI